MKCKECKFWKRERVGELSLDYGVCIELQSSIDIILSNYGANVDTIETDEIFFCSSFKTKELKDETEGQKY